MESKYLVKYDKTPLTWTSWSDRLERGRGQPRSKVQQPLEVGSGRDGWWWWRWLVWKAMQRTYQQSCYKCILTSSAAFCIHRHAKNWSEIGQIKNNCSHGDTVILIKIGTQIKKGKKKNRVSTNKGFGIVTGWKHNPKGTIVGAMVAWPFCGIYFSCHPSEIAKIESTWSVD